MTTDLKTDLSALLALEAGRFGDHNQHPNGKYTIEFDTRDQRNAYHEAAKHGQALQAMLKNEPELNTDSERVKTVTIEPPIAIVGKGGGLGACPVDGATD